MENKFDRQERLWGVDAQETLRVSTIIVLGCTSTLTAALKSLVLAGVGHIIIVDEQMVSGALLESKYFVKRTSLQTSLSKKQQCYEEEESLLSTNYILAKTISEFLEELNDKCVIEIINKHPIRWVSEDFCSFLVERSSREQENEEEQLLSETCFKQREHEKCSIFKNYKQTCLLMLVSTIYTDFSPCSLLCSLCRPKNIAVICVESCGMIGFLQLCSNDSIATEELNALQITEARNWHLIYPFDELRAFCDEHDTILISYIYHAYNKWVNKKRLLGTMSSIDDENSKSTKHIPLSKEECLEVWTMFTAEWRSLQEQRCCFRAAATNDSQNNDLYYDKEIMSEAEQCIGMLKKFDVIPHNVQSLLSCKYCSNPQSYVKHFYLHENIEAWTIKLQIDMLCQHDVLVWYVLFGVRQFCMSCANQEIDALSFEKLPFCGDFSALAINSISSANREALIELCDRKHNADVQKVVQLSWEKLCIDWTFLENDRAILNNHNDNVSGNDNDDIVISKEQYKTLHGLRTNLEKMAEYVIKNILKMHLIQFYAIGNVAMELVTTSMKWGQILQNTLSEKWKSHITRSKISTCDLRQSMEKKLVQLCFTLAIYALHELRRESNCICAGDHLYTYAKELIKFDNVNDSSNIDNNYYNSDSNNNTVANVFNVCSNTLLKHDDYNGNIKPELESTCELVRQTELVGTEYSIATNDELFLEMKRCLDVLRDCCHEVARTQSCEFVPISNMLGALAAEEAIKLIQHQRVPINAPHIFDGFTHELFVV